MKSCPMFDLGLPCPFQEAAQGKVPQGRGEGEESSLCYLVNNSSSLAVHGADDVDMIIFEPCRCVKQQQLVFSLPPSAVDSWREF
ncbi:unnamed protein product [Victoria cruziana]